MRTGVHKTEFYSANLLTVQTLGVITKLYWYVIKGMVNDLATLILLYMYINMALYKLSLCNTNKLLIQDRVCCSTATKDNDDYQ